MSEPEPKLFESRSRSRNKKCRLHNTVGQTGLGSWLRPGNGDVAVRLEFTNFCCQLLLWYSANFLSNDNYTNVGNVSTAIVSAWPCKCHRFMAIFLTYNIGHNKPTSPMSVKHRHGHSKHWFVFVLMWSCRYQRGVFFLFCSALRTGSKNMCPM